MAAPVPLAYLSLPTSLPSACAIFYGRTLFTCHGSPRGTSPDQPRPVRPSGACQNAVQGARQQLHLELATVARPQVRALARFNYLPLVFVLAFAPFQQLLLLCRLRGPECCLACLLGLFGLFACLFVCPPVCLAVCLSGRLHFTAVKQLNLSRKLDKVRLEWRQGRGYCCCKSGLFPFVCGLCLSAVEGCSYNDN